MAYKKFKKSYKSKKPYKKANKSFKKKYHKKKAYKKKSYGKKIEVVNGGTGPRHTFCKHTFAKHALVPKVFKMLTAPMRYRFNNPALAYSGTGRQFAGNVGTFGDKADLGRMLQAARTQLGAGTPAAATDADSIYLLDSSMEYLFMNNSLAPMELDIYDFVCHRDTKYSASAMFGFIGGAYTFPISGSISINSDLPGTHPMESVAFRKAYMIRNWKRVQLNAGQGHKHTVKNVYNKFVSQAMLGEDPDYFKGFTSGIMIVGKGYPMHSTADSNDAAYAACRVDVAGSGSYNYRWRNPSREHMDYDDIMPVITTANQTLINQNGTTVHTGITYT